MASSVGAVAGQVLNSSSLNHISLLMSKLGNNTSIFSKEVLSKPRELLNELLTIYVVSSVSNPASVVKFPVIEALVRWGTSNTNSTISKLLDDSKRLAKQDHSSVAEDNSVGKISKEDQVFFSYLQCSSKYAWHDASQSLRNMETSNISNALLGNDVVEKVVKKFETVKQLAAACEDGFAGLDVMHHEREQQQGMARNIKDIFLGKIASGICYAFNTVKSNFITTPSNQEQGKKIVADLVKLVEKNALQLKLGAADEGIRLVMDELIKIDSLHKEGDITITNALTTLVEQHFTSAKKEKAFSLLTGLKRETNKQRNTYYYKTLTPDDDLVNKETNDGDKDHQKDWLDMANTDYVLQKPEPAQESCSAGNSSGNSGQPYLHYDWDFIKVESKEGNEESYEEQSRGNIIFSFGCSKGTAASIRKMIFMALPFFIIANAIPLAGLVPIPNVGPLPSAMINITNATELGMIGNSPQYLVDGNYQFMNSFDASSFNQSIPYFNGSINGNNYTICNLQTCLIGTLAGNGNVQNLNIDSANITNTGHTGAVAKIMEDNALIRFIRIDKSFIGGGDSIGKAVGAVAGQVRDSSHLNKIIVANSFVRVIDGSGNGTAYHCFVGGVAGEVSGFSQLNGITVINSIVIVIGSDSCAAGVAAKVSYHVVIDTVTVINTQIEAIDERSCAGAGLGWMTQKSALMNINVINSTAKVFGHASRAGGAAGLLMGEVVVQNATVRNTWIEAMNRNSWAAVGAGQLYGTSHFTILKSINNTIKTHELFSCSGVGAGEVTENANICGILSINTLIEADAHTSYVAWGVGYLQQDGKVSNVQIIDSNIAIKGVIGTRAGAVVGMRDTSHSNNDSVSNVTVTNSLIEVSGSEIIGICPESIAGGGVSICDGIISERYAEICIGNATGEGVSIRTKNNDILYVVYDNKVNDGDNMSYKHVYLMKNLNNQCQWNESHFVINDCGMKGEAFEGHEYLAVMSWIELPKVCSN